MSTTSLKLPNDVKALAVAAARHRGVTPHAFMVEAIRAAATAADQRARFVADALASEAETIASGEVFAADDVHSFVISKARGETVSPPNARRRRG